MTVRAIVFCSIVAFATGQASAEWVLLSDFDSLNTGTLGNQGGWTAAPDDIYQVTADPDNPANQAVQVSSGGGNAYIALGGGVAEGETSTLFFRARNGNPGDLVFGSSDVAAPAAWGDYEGYMRLAAGNVDVRDAGGFSNGGTYSADTWTNVWLVLDNASDMTTMYSSVGMEPAGNAVTGGFRNTTTDALVTANIRAGNNQAGVNGYLDDIYMSAGTNLTNPVPEPNSLLLVLISGFCLTGLLRQRSR